MEKDHREEYRVRQDCVDRNANLRMDSAFHLMQDLAVLHADAIGVGMENLKEHHLMWVLSRLKISFERIPLLGETLLGETWPHGIHKLFAIREFRFRTKTGEKIASATSCWLLLDAVSGRPKRIEGNLPAPLPDNSERSIAFPGLEKLVRLPVSEPFSVKVPESAIDVNQHMNNAFYITYACDWLAAKTNGPAPVRELQVNFVAATKLGTELTVAGSLEGKRFSIEIGEGDLLHAQIEGTLF